MPDGSDEPFLVLPGQVEGVYATAAVVWHGRYDFTIDFAAQLGPDSDDLRDAAADLGRLVVVRVRLPVGFAFDLIRMISATMETYEARWGEIHHPERRERGEQ